MSKKEKENEDLDVRVQVLELIRKSAAPLSHRLDALLRDHYKDSYSQTDTNLTYLLEYASSARVLLQTLDKYISLANDLEKKVVTIPFQDFTIITHTSRVVEQGYRIRIGQIPMWAH